jgi:hypothetical protein
MTLSSKPPPGDPHQNCTQFGDGRNGGLIVKRPLSNFVRQHKQREGQLLWTLSLLAGNVSLDKDLKAFYANSTGLTQ